MGDTQYTSRNDRYIKSVWRQQQSSNCKYTLYEILELSDSAKDLIAVTIDEYPQISLIQAYEWYKDNINGKAQRLINVISELDPYLDDYEKITSSLILGTCNLAEIDIFDDLMARCIIENCAYNESNVLSSDIINNAIYYVEKILNIKIIADKDSIKNGYSLVRRFIYMEDEIIQSGLLVDYPINDYDLINKLTNNCGIQSILNRLLKLDMLGESDDNKIKEQLRLIALVCNMIYDDEIDKSTFGYNMITDYFKQEIDNSANTDGLKRLFLKRLEIIVKHTNNLEKGQIRQLIFNTAEYEKFVETIYRA